MSNFSKKNNTDSRIKRTDNVPVSHDNSNSKHCRSLCHKMDTSLDTSDFYESDLAIAQYTSKLRAEDLKVVASIPKFSFGEDSAKGALDTPEISLNLSDFIDTPELHKFTTGEGLFPQINLLTFSQEEKSNSVSDIATTMPTPSSTYSKPTSQTNQMKVAIKPELVEVDGEVEMVSGDNDMTQQAILETIDLANYMKPNQVVVVKQELPDMPEMMGQFISLPESPGSDDTCESYDFTDSINVPTPVEEVGCEYSADELHGKSPSPSKGMRNSKQEHEKGSNEYRLKRERNNVAVRKSREKARERQRQTEQKVKGLVTENKQLSKKLELVTKELTVLRGLFSNANIRGLISPQHQKIFERLNR